MSNVPVESHDDIILRQRKEKKELLAETVKLKHSIPKGDKKKKKDVTTEIAQMLANQDLKHDKELKEFEALNFSDPINETSKDDSEKQLTKLEKKLPASDCSELSHGQTTVPKISKAQKRRNKKNMQEKEREMAIAEQELDNLNGMRFLEFEKISKKLSERQLDIYEVPSDGNCLYKAIEHQLSILKPEVNLTVSSLRSLTAIHLLEHKDDYIPFITDPKTGEILSDEQYVKYCEDIVTTSSWGGHVEIQALSCKVDATVEVIQADGPSIIIGKEAENNKLIISYHKHAYGLGEHYNSVVKVKK